VALAGGGNSAGQAAVYLSSRVAKVRLILEDSLTRYPVERITARPNVEILTETTVIGLEGQEGILEAICCRFHRYGEEKKFGARPSVYIHRGGSEYRVAVSLRRDAR
jgi:thioredoxin reductase (NADPH)